MKRFYGLLSLVVFLTGITGAMAQSGELTGRVTDEKNEGAISANVVVEQNGVFITGASTDFDGYYSIKPLSPGRYDIKVSYLGHNTEITRDVIIAPDRPTKLNAQLTVKEELLDVIIITDYKVPLIDKGKTPTKNDITSQEIALMPTKSVQGVAATSAAVYQKNEGDGISIKGGREDATHYYVDGIKVRGSTAIPTSAIEQMTVITGGIPARYGDATGGIISITTRGPSKVFAGSVEGMTSQFLDPYGYNLGSFNLTGPIIKTGKGTKFEKSILGFFIAGEYLRQKDPTPSYVGYWKVKDDRLQDLHENPLQPAPLGEGYIMAAERMTMDDFEHIDAQENVVNQQIGLTGKLDLRVSDLVNVSFGGTYNLRTYHDGGQNVATLRRFHMFNTDNHPYYTNNTYRGYARLTQRFRNPVTELQEGEEAPDNVFANAFYSIQFDYTKVFNKRENERLGFEPFKYGYVGQFESQRTPVYAYNTVTFDDSTYFSGFTQVGYQDTLVTFTPSDINPIYSNYTKQYFELAGENPEFYTSLGTIRQRGGLLNGDFPRISHGIWYSPGYAFNAYGVNSDNDQFRLSVMGSVDIRPGGSELNKHAVEFGFEFEQRIDRSYQINPVQLWSLMRLQANRHLSELNPASGLMLIDGVLYDIHDPARPNFYSTDTIVFDRLYNPADQSFFDKQLRTALGKPVDGTEWIDIDALSPETFSLDMFSADEILDFNPNSPMLFYYGYDYKGNRLSGQPAFSDYWRDKDEFGNLKRTTGAFRPIYTAAYVQDQFTFRDVLFNLGLRVDRFDANQKVLRDPYSLYAIRSVSEVDGALNQVSGAHPSNIGGDFAVYVNDVDNPTNILGYRDGDRWFNAEGLEINDPSIIAKSTNSSRITPYLVDPNQDIKSTNPDEYDPDMHFKDYEPQISIMPRVAFSFELTDEASFFAHYDVLTQRPQSRLIATPDQWLFFEDNIGSFINNPALKPERTIDYQLGFVQKVSSSSAITLSAFYREIRDMVQVVNIEHAYPGKYSTFGNIDFGTVKGFSVAYDLRRTRNVTLKANYTLQFAEGTGSNSTSQINILSSGPNLRTLVPLDYDSRHQLNITADYSFADGRNYNGPVLGEKKRQILANSGISLITRARSGEPFSKQESATAEALFTSVQSSNLKGQINSSRLPWNFRLDARVYKDFKMQFSRTPETEDGAPAAAAPKTYYLSVYLMVQNVLNTRNIVGVYNYTGNPDDDGYLGSPRGIQNVSNQADIDPVQAQAFQDQYRTWIDNPQHYGLPRVIRLGAIFNF